MDTKIPKWGRKATPPPPIKKGERVKIIDVTIEETEGKYGQQYQFKGKLQGTDYTATAWIRHYDEPSQKSDLYIQGVYVQEYYGQEFDTLEHMIQAMSNITEWIFECKDHKHVEDEDYPRFKVYKPVQPEPAQSDINRPWTA